MFGEKSRCCGGSLRGASAPGADVDVVRLLTRLPGRAGSSALLQNRVFGLKNKPLVKAKSLLKPYPEELMDAHDVSPIVNSAKYDGPECIQPFSDDEIPRGGQLSLL